MTEGHEHAPTHPARGDAAAAEVQPAFTDTEVRAFRESDVSAGRAIVILMQGIFLIGLVLYLIVAWSVT
jgi:hypothetical protein